jgi:hypothetical protein
MEPGTCQARREGLPCGEDETVRVMKKGSKDEVD